jgi:serine/threonine protein kinase
MARLPDLVRDSQLNVELRDGCTVHGYFESSLASRQRAVPREETWKQERHIGGGAFGSVWLETCTNGRQKGVVRAVKKIALGRNSARDAAYIRELEAVAKFSHPKVWRLVLARFFRLQILTTLWQYERCFVKSFGWYESLGSLCIAMEYCELGDLQGYLSSAPPLPEIQAQEITFQTLEGVRYMHENEFAHRDLKPGVRSQIPGFKVRRV